MERSEVLKKIKDFVVERNERIDLIEEESLLRDDLGLDSLDIVELAMELESQFSINITNKQIDDWRRVSDILKDVCK